MGNRKRKKTSQIVFRLLALLSMLVGLALLLYPSVADRINNSFNAQAIENYRREVMALDSSAYEAALEAARSYNEELAKTTPYITTLSGEKRQEYESLLDLDGTGIMGYIEIPKSDIYLAIYHGTEESTLQTGIGHLEASSLPLPGKSVHTVLTGHSGLPSARLFTDLDRLEIGDTFTLHILRETLTYRVEDTRRVLPEEVENMRIEEGQELCTLMTCTPYGINTHRLVVTGRRIETPAQPQTERPQPVTQLVTSKWNRWFLFLPAGIFVGIVVTVLVIHKKRKHR